MSNGSTVRANDCAIQETADIITSRVALAFRVSLRYFNDNTIAWYCKPFSFICCFLFRVTFINRVPALVHVYTCYIIYLSSYTRRDTQQDSLWGAAKARGPSVVVLRWEAPIGKRLAVHSHVAEPARAVHLEPRKQRRDHGGVVRCNVLLLARVHRNVKEARRHVRLAVPGMPDRWWDGSAACVGTLVWRGRALDGKIPRGKRLPCRFEPHCVLGVPPIRLCGAVCKQLEIPHPQHCRPACDTRRRRTSIKANVKESRGGGMKGWGTCSGALLRATFRWVAVCAFTSPHAAVWSKLRALLKLS